MADKKKEIFADGIGQIHFAGGMVRFDFVTLQPQAEGKEPIPEANVRVIMPPQGFLAAFDSMQQLINKLGIADIAMHKAHAIIRDAVEILEIARICELVDYADGIRRVEDDMPRHSRSDESGAAGYDDAVHDCPEMLLSGKAVRLVPVEKCKR